MTVREYWKILIKRWYIVLICFLVVGLGTFVGSKLMKPLYQSSTLVRVVIRSSSSNQADYNNLQASDQLVQTEADLATSVSVLQAVASDYPGLTAGQLAGEVSSTTKLNTQLFEIDVVDHDPEQAAKIANDVAATLIKQQNVETQQENEQSQQQIQQSINQTSQEISDTTTRISTLQEKPGNQGQIALLQAQLSSLQQRYTQLQTALAQLELAQAESGNPLQIVQQAQSNTTPVRPNIPLYTSVGLIVGLLLGMILIVALEQFDTRVRTPEEIAQFLAWPVLATIWRDKSAQTEKALNLAEEGINVESFRMLRANVGFSSLDNRLRSIVITSAQQGDGKSSVASRLAIFMASAGKSTLLIDGDLRRPIQRTLFNLPPDKLGLSNAVLALSMNTALLQPQSESSTTQFPLEMFIHTVSVPNLWVMPSGPLPPNPSEFLESKVMQRFLAIVVKCGVEVIIIDAPPLLGLSDASILASKVDCALVVVDTTRATKERLRQMKATISQAGVHMLGCVANKAPYKRNENASYSYYSIEDQDSGGKSAHNGHSPDFTTTPTQIERSVGQTFRSN